jgi:polyisoprenyl-phosphate glycosyltransferase
MSPHPPKLSLVLPCLNEGFHLDHTLKKICDQLSFLDGDFELLVIDDGSTDDTWRVIENYSQNCVQLRGLRLSRRFGKELAITAGLEHACGQAVVVMDADLQHPPSLIPDMVKYWEEDGFDVVEAVKVKRGEETMTSRLGALLFSAVHRNVSSLDLQGATDFKLMDRKVLNAWASMPERNVFFRGMSAWLGFRRMTISFEVAAGTRGKSNWSGGELLRLAFTGITAFSTVPIQIVTWIGALFLVFAIVLGAITLAAWINGNAVEGFTTVIILQLAIASMMMISLGILGTYIARIYEEVKQRPRYVLTQVIGPNKTNA